MWWYSASVDNFFTHFKNYTLIARIWWYITTVKNTLVEDFLVYLTMY